MNSIQKGKPLPDNLLESSVKRQDGEVVSISSLVDKRPTAFVFIRHFGCLGCALQMEDLAPRVDEITRLGLNLILIGNGNPEHIEGFLDRYNLKPEQLTVVTDPTLKAYENAGFKTSGFKNNRLQRYVRDDKGFTKGPYPGWHQR